MSLRFRVLPSLLNGVSRQPPMLRSADQNEAELNTWSTLSTGLGKRPPSEHIAKVMNGSDPSAFIHYINRDTTERYCVVIGGGGIRVFDASTGAEKPVFAPAGWGYLAGGSYRAVTVADYTFIVNTARVCQQAAKYFDRAPPPESYRWVSRVDAGSNGTTYVVGGVQVQYPSNPTPLAYGGEVTSMEKLPETAPHGTLYKVTGSTEAGFTSYYVIRSGAVWDEAVGPDETNAIDANTMPHCLVRDYDGTFVFAPFSWAPRRVGDRNTNPVPTFVNRRITDVFFYQNRLGLLVDENVVFSCAGDFGNFWRNTVLDHIDSDVVDAAVATASVAMLRYAIPFNDGIMAFADQIQFAVENGEDGLTPASLSISPVTRYEINKDVRPVALANEVYFCGNQSGSSAVWEYTRIEQGDSLVAADITAHVPDYIPANLKQLVSAPNAKALFALTGGPDVYAYQFYWNGNEKVLSAWRRWTFGYPVIAGEYIDGHLNIAIQRPDGVYLEKLNLQEGARPAEQFEQVYLDSRRHLTGTYDPVGDRTTFLIPYSSRQANFQLVRTSSHPSAPGALIDPSSYDWTSSATLRVPGNVASATGGEAYEQRVQFSRQFPQDYQGRPVTTGRLQLRTFTVNYANTAFFRTEVAPYGTALAPDIEEIVPAKLAEFTGKVIGVETLRLNRPIYHTGSYSFQVYGDASLAEITLTNDTHCGATFVSAEWEGFYFNRASQ